MRIDAEVLDELRVRIRNARLPERAPGGRWEQGTDRDYLESLLGYWAESFDWRAQERAVNSFAQFRAEIDGASVHFVHERARGGGGFR